jgi:hypothetical protein
MKSFIVCVLLTFSFTNLKSVSAVVLVKSYRKCTTRAFNVLSVLICNESTVSARRLI